MATRRSLGMLCATVAIALVCTSACAEESDDPGEWPMAAKDYASTRYSTLSDITPDNVARLRLAFSFPLGVSKGQESGPLVIGDTMFVATPYPNHVYALDLSRPGANVKWTFDPRAHPSAQGMACCDAVTRGLAYTGGRVFMATLDMQAIALDAETGRELWRTQIGDFTKGETVTMAPLVVKDKVLIGNSGSEMGARGWVVALDTATGKEAWRAYSTGPDAEVLIGEDFKPFYAHDRGEDLGVATWPPDAWKNGGGTVWGWISYDAKRNLIYYGTANPSPWNAEQRPGDNKWTAGIFARDIDTGQARWFYQYAPHDLHDYNGTNENVLLTLPFGGALRDVIVHPDRDGYMYVLDRDTGEVVSAEPFVHVTTINGIDSATGRPILNPKTIPKVGQLVRNVCPASPGGKDWQPSAWSPRTGLLYLPHQNLCQDMMSYEASHIRGTPYLGAEVRMYPGPGGHRGVFGAWDPVKGEMVWAIRENFPVWSGAVATAGDVVFYGTMDGWFKAVDARDGKLLWKAKTDSGIIGQPITYRGPDGRQYVAIQSGVGGWAGAVVSKDLDVRDRTAAKGFASAMADLPEHTGKGGTLYVFSLP